MAETRDDCDYGTCRFDQIESLEAERDQATQRLEGCRNAFTESETELQMVRQRLKEAEVLLRRWVAFTEAGSQQLRTETEVWL